MEDKRLPGKIIYLLNAFERGRFQFEDYPNGKGFTGEVKLYEGKPFGDEHPRLRTTIGRRVYDDGRTEYRMWAGVNKNDLAVWADSEEHEEIRDLGKKLFGENS
ncbi:hypothetical protein COU61_02225 [Candidatus Pacearchaeota archaeon CG10_big_fil_rev_8_21_14_0_10_35_13]|nr:MAG: hypothetical protein COU61_02225 [Candidatus Pacearchaeota archaeon CG10_big_fil_rev_8_21_14_0_10_35_13]